ncbi:magnesium/cobalt transporter CorA [Phycicoccus endophyticus]|uniref:Magnesium transport protein CorA n=1 Tax=Phycicoccus endophyticus TaxID=1690220 RepID=A0A7G9R4H4_9MICO|nr:magnesium/cobalt transporter CorA [Phycicoccus endophyticus]NHI18384.1 magnesium/cobalt transporter CorA [Phycicoccus endophyticus]QNN50499.1 magnesium/cobalt transporter CorA [Phycicoccus endophyticus]
MIVDRAIYEDGTRRDCGDLSDELERLRSCADPSGFLWIGLKDPTQEEFDSVDTELGLHPLAVEDAVQGRQRAKVELYDGTVFVVLKPLRYLDRTSDIETGEVMLFVGDRFVVTVRRGELTPLTDLRRRLEEDPQRLRLGPLAVLHAVLDRVVDDYLEIDAEVQTDLDEIETAVFSDERSDTAAIYELKREVLEFRRAAMPLAEPLRTLHASPRSPVPEGELRLLLRDVSDHLHSVIDHIESYDNLLSGILDAHLAQVSVQQNDDMRKISAWVAIAALPTMVAGIYGMNFEHMPELHWRFGYPLAVAVMAVSCGTLFRLFKRAGWL